MKKEKQKNKGVHLDVYIQSKDRLKKVKNEVRRQKSLGVSDACPSSVIRQAIDIGVPVIGNSKIKHSPIIQKFDLVNVRVHKRAKTYVVVVSNLQDGENVMVGVDAMTKDDGGTTIKLYERAAFSRAGAKITAVIKKRDK